MFKVGDVVRSTLSGEESQWMTVNRIDYLMGSPEVIVDCVWFEGNVLKRREFPQEALVYAYTVR